MHIEIEIKRPIATLCTIAGVLGFITWNVADLTIVAKDKQTATVQAVGGATVMPQEEVHASEEDIRRAKQQQAVLEHKEEILRYQLRTLKDAILVYEQQENADMTEKLRTVERELAALLRNKHEAEQYLVSAFQQLWEAQIRGGRVSQLSRGKPRRLSWPVEPLYGLSATFKDEGYEEIFGMPHEAIDIPVPQGTVIGAAAPGVVEQVVDNGYGYNYLIISHDGVATLYGHVEEFLVEEGQQVYEGQPIAHSGGQPGTRGAGALTTGPHLHLEAIVDGVRVNPEALLPLIEE